MSGTNELGGYASPLSAYEAHTDFIQWRNARPNVDRLAYASVYASKDEASAIVSREHLEDFYARSERYYKAGRTFTDELLLRADTVFLSDALHELVDKSSESMPDEVLFRTDVYTPCAMVFLQRPIYVTASESCLASEVDAVIREFVSKGGIAKGTRRHEVSKDGMCSGSTTYAVRAFTWADSDALNPYAIEAMRNKYGQQVVDEFVEQENTLVVMTFGTIVTSEIDGVELTAQGTEIEQSLNVLMMVDKFYFSYDENGYNDEQEQLESVAGKESWNSGVSRHRGMRRFVVALLRLMNEYVDIDNERAPRAHAKRGVRAKRLSTETVTTLSLRRSVYGDDATNTGRKITLAHLVRGHWRNQWYPSQQTHRARWINAHRRGGTPTDTVNETRRLVKVDK